MENTRKPPYLHVKHRNTRKTGTKNGREYTFFSDRQNIENTSKVGSFFRVPEPILHVLTVIYLFRRKMTKPTMHIYIPLRGNYH